MSAPDIIGMFGNLSESLPSLNRLLGGLSYLLGIVFYLHSFGKFKEILAEGGGQQNKVIVPVAYFLAGLVKVIMYWLIRVLIKTIFMTL